jgi:hypothetical protein
MSDPFGAQPRQRRRRKTTVPKPLRISTASRAQSASQSVTDCLVFALRRAGVCYE